MTNKNNVVAPFPVIEPWYSPVDGAVLADEITAVLNRFIYLPAGAADAIAMWILHTYNVNMFDFTPRLCILSPEKRCGKTSLLTLIEQLSFNVLNVSGITASAMFRSIDMWHPTMLVDEVDTFIRGNDEFRGIINNGYKKGGMVIRTEVVNKTFVPKPFACYAPVALAGIGNLPDTITDRGVIITMRRQSGKAPLPKIRTREIAPLMLELRRKCLRFIKDHVDEISSQRPRMPDSFNDRAADIWEPLFAIASVISPEWERRIRTASIALIRASRADDGMSDTEQLLSDIRQIFAQENTDWLSSESLIARLKEIEDSPWGEWNRVGLNVHSLAGLLSKHGIRPNQSRVGGNRSRRYKLEQFRDVFERYLPPFAPPDCASVPSEDNLAQLSY